MNFGTLAEMKERIASEERLPHNVNRQSYTSGLRKEIEKRKLLLKKLLIKTTDIEFAESILLENVGFHISDKLVMNESRPVPIKDGMGKVVASGQVTSSYVLFILENKLNKGANRP